MNSTKRQKDRRVKDELTKSVGAQYATGDQWRNNLRKNEEMEPKQKQHPVVDVTGDGSKVRCYKEQYCIGSWNVRSMNQGKFSSVQFSHSVVSDSLRPHGPQHAGPPCPSPTPRVYPNSSPLSWLCHPTISSSVVPSSSCLQSFPTSGFLQMSQLFIQVAKVLEFQLQHQFFQ